MQLSSVNNAAPPLGACKLTLRVLPKLHLASVTGPIGSHKFSAPLDVVELNFKRSVSQDMHTLSADAAEFCFQRGAFLGAYKLTLRVLLSFASS